MAALAALHELHSSGTIEYAEAWLLRLLLTVSRSISLAVCASLAM